MSFMLRRGREQRAMMGGPFTWGVTRSDFSSSAIVPPPGLVSISAESSLQNLAIWNCVNLTASLAQTLPLDVFSGDGTDKRPRPMPSWLADLAGDGHGIHDWAFQFLYSGMLRGNVFAPIVDRDVRGNPRQLPIAHPDDVRATNDGWRIGNREYGPDEVWHQRFFPVPGSRVGLSPIQIAMVTVGLGIDALAFGAQWFRDGAIPSSLLTTEKPIDKAVADEAKSRWMTAVRGRREPAVLGNGWKWQQVSVAPNESQFLQTQGWTEAQCCRIFGPAYAEVLGYETGGSMTYSNREQRTLDLLAMALDPWFVRLERALSSLLPQPQFVKLNRDALLRTDVLSRYKAHNIALASKFETVDEVRELEDLPPLTADQKAQMAEITPAPTQAFDQSGAK